MNSEEKAKWLLEKYYELTAIDNRSYQFDTAIIIHSPTNKLKSIIRAAECSILAVDEILKAIHDDQPDDPEHLEMYKNYWKQIKAKLETYAFIK